MRSSKDQGAPGIADASPLVVEREAGDSVGGLNHFVLAVASLALVLVRLPALAGGGSVRLAGLMPFVLAIVLLSDRPRRPSPLGASLLWAFAMVGIVSLYRGRALVGSGSAILIDCLTLLVVTRFVVLLMATATDRERNARLAAVALAPACFMAANVVLQMAGFQAPIVEAGYGALASGDQAEMLRVLGISASRVEFPLSSGINSTGAVAAAGLAAAALMAIQGKGVVPRKVSLAACVICLYGVLVIDSRGALLFAVLIVLLLTVLPRINLSWLTLLLPVSSALVLYVLRQLAETGLVAGVSRSGEDLASGNNRLYIWEPIWDFVQHPSIEMIFGYGAKGHISSGVSATYAYLFADDFDPYSYSTHNVAMQTLLDSGYLGLVVLVALAFAAMRAVRALPSPFATAVSAMVLVIFLAGMTEALPNVLFMDTMIVTILGAGVALGHTPEAAVPRAVRHAWRPPRRALPEPSWLKGRT